MNDITGWLVFLAIVILTFILVWALLRNRPTSTHEENVSHENQVKPQQREEVPVTVEHEDISDLSQNSMILESEQTEEKIDNLEIIEGIGPKISQILKTAGVTTFKELSIMDPTEIKKILVASNLRVNDPTTWPEQARLAELGDMQALIEFQNRLRGGRE